MLNCCVTFILFCSCVFIVHDVQGAGVSSLVKVRRTQSMKPLISHGSEIDSNMRARSDSLSSISSIDAQASESISNKRIDRTSLKEAESHSIAENPKHVNFRNADILGEASTSTFSDGNIDPTQHGVFARVRNAITQYGAAVVGVGAIGVGVGAIGVGANEFGKSLFPNNNHTQLNNTIISNQTETQADDCDVIINHM